uniref:Diphthamide biosynthesis protein 1 n=1 Tax=Lygus hesperus TaxID=30085 RepID=A0A0A9X8C9_LYGHE
MFLIIPCELVAASLLLFAAVTDGDVTAPTPPPELIASMNKYLDTVFSNIANNATTLNIEPLSLPNVTQSLTTKWYFPYTHLNLTEGTLTNLQSIKRHGDCVVSYKNDTIEISVDAAFTDLQVDYDFEALSSYSWFSLSGLLHGEVGETQVYADITLDANTLGIRAKKISFPGTKKIDFCIQSTILATWVVNAILEVVSLFSGLIIDDVQDAVTSAFNDFFEHEFPHIINQGRP